MNEQVPAEKPQEVVPWQYTPEEEAEHQQAVRLREARVGAARAAVVRAQLVEAYAILDRVRLTPGLSDSAFRDKLTIAKRGVESMLDDFLLDDTYWRQQLAEARRGVSPPLAGQGAAS